MQSILCVPEEERPAGARETFPELVARLSRLSVTKHYDAYADVPWDDPAYKIDPDDPRWEAGDDHAALAAKLSGCDGLSFRRPRITCRTFSIVSLISIDVGDWMVMPSTIPCGFTSRCMCDVAGAITKRSSENPKIEPCFSATPTTVYGSPPIRISRPIGS